ncbi:7860_t:CDS:1, partial [Gigaspora rosea]
KAKNTPVISTVKITSTPTTGNKGSTFNDNTESDEITNILIKVAPKLSGGTENDDSEEN